MRSFVLSILQDSLSHIRKIKDNDKEKYFLLYDSFTLFLAQTVREYKPDSFECHINPFSLFAFLCKETEMPEDLRFAGFKLLRRQKEILKDTDGTEFENLYWAILEIAEHLYGKSIWRETGEKPFFPADEFWERTDPGAQLGVTRVVLTGRKSPDSGILYGYWVDREGEEVTLRPDEMMRIKNQMVTLEHLNEVFLPITVNLLDVEVKGTILYPTAMVISPDYLVDITAVANCFTPFGETLSSFLADKITPFRQSHHLLIGNCVNALLDELVYNPELEWEEAVKGLFRISEFQWATCNDEMTKRHIGTIRNHFLHLKNTFRTEFREKGIDPDHFAVEPSFYSPLYGLQGRLDLLYESEREEEARMIVELKSGKIFRPNSYGLNPPHYLQTILYDLLIRSAYPEGTEPVNYILYSSEPEKNLRHAPAIREWQYEALGVRNQMVILEWRLARWTKTDNNIYEILKELDEQLVGFAASDLSSFFQTYEAAEPVVRAYFDEYLKFLTREQITSKLGVLSSDRKGQSQLWATSWENKFQQYLLLSHLKVTEDKSSEENPVVTFSKTERTNPLANFRKGDVILAYPSRRREHPEEGEIFRCTLVENSAKYVEIRLRARQHRSIFEVGSEWFIEHDHLDSSFRYMTQGLSAVLSMTGQKAALYLGTRAPEKPDEMPYTSESERGLVPNQQAVLTRMLHLKDYFLLWGPPGTGKTSVMLKEFVREKTLKNTATRILLLGYTNRAVDEICAAVLSLEHLSEKDIVRLGSRYGADPQFQSLLWRVRSENIRRRAEVRELLEESRIVCATVASLAGQSDIFDLVSFDMIMIDEASQILEPAILPILSRGIPYVLIGDHKQLPAVVGQASDDMVVTDPLLLEIGLKSPGNSYFERLFLISQAKNRDWSYGILKHQGRMHQDLMSYPNTYFYDHILSVLPFGDGQHRALSKTEGPADGWMESLASCRTVFIPTMSRNSLNYKINEEEAEKIVEIIRFLKEKRPELASGDIGVITPYRAQISAIRHALEKQDISDDQITVDTVERYQGGAKSVIIISYCVNAMSQIQMLRESTAVDGIDRKLNVALTRAREQVVFLANEELLRHHPLYAALIDHYSRVEITET